LVHAFYYNFMEVERQKSGEILGGLTDIYDRKPIIDRIYIYCLLTVQIALWKVPVAISGCRFGTRDQTTHSDCSVNTQI
jgi:hypothetical protein